MDNLVGYLQNFRYTFQDEQELSTVEKQLYDLIDRAQQDPFPGIENPPPKMAKLLHDFKANCIEWFNLTKKSRKRGPIFLPKHLYNFQRYIQKFQVEMFEFSQTLINQNSDDPKTKSISKALEFWHSIPGKRPTDSAVLFDDFIHHYRASYSVLSIYAIDLLKEFMSAFVFQVTFMKVVEVFGFPFRNLSACKKAKCQKFELAAFGISKNCLYCQHPKEDHYIFPKYDLSNPPETPKIYEKNPAPPPGMKDIHVAVLRNDEKEVEKIIKKDKKVLEERTEDQSHMMPLTLAGQQGMKRMIDLLIKSGAKDIPECFFEAAKSNQQEIVLELLEQFPFLMKATDGNGETILHILTEDYDKEDLLKKILARKMDISNTNTQGKTALHKAVENNNPNAVKLLINHGANVNARDHKNITPLIQSVISSDDHIIDPQIVEILLNSGADPKCIDIENKTALHHAIIGNAPKEVIELLFKKSPETLSYIDKSGKNPVQYVIASGRKELFPLLAKFANITKKQSLLDEAIGNSQFEFAKQLLKNNQSSNEISPESMQIAIKSGDEELFHLLMDKGGPIDWVSEPERQNIIHQMTDSGFQFQKLYPKIGEVPLEVQEAENQDTCLHSAARKNEVELAKRIIEEKPSLVNFQNNQNETPIHTAIETGHQEVARVLIDSPEARLEMKDNQGETALSKASRLGQLEIVKLISKKGVDLNAVNKEGMTPLYQAAYFGHYEVLKNLIKNGANPRLTSRERWSPLHAAVHQQHKDCVQLLIQNDCPIDVANNALNTPLVFAAESGNLDILVFLLDHNASINLGGDWNPLTIAMKKGHTEIIKVLLKRGADIYRVDPEVNYECPNYLAMMLRYDGDEELWNILFSINSKMANFHGNDAFIPTPVFTAAVYKRIKTLKILLNHGADLKKKNSRSETVAEYISNFIGYEEILKILGVDEILTLDGREKIEMKISDLEDLLPEVPPHPDNLK
eukprot:Anaeramoba_ignava/a91581_78.p1 GENE.a91581_78~~a91581_78.p1  ORF type:complete len:972 (+),score=309.43 a91581_78:916-3831(+)